MNEEETVKQTFDKVWKTVIERTKKKVSPVILTPKGYVYEDNLVLENQV